MMAVTSEPGFRMLGQSTARRVAQQSAMRGELGRTLLVHGPAGAGKTAFVDDLLALAFCEASDVSGRPCNVCRGCRDARARSHPDLVIGSPDVWRDQRTTGESIVAAARRWLLEAAGAPVVAERRVVLIEGLDRASEATHNALLKALEEPTDRHTFILVADEPARLPSTIRSRCRVLRIGALSRAELVNYLMDSHRLPADQAQAVAQLSGGLVGRAVEFVTEPGRLDWRRRLLTELVALLASGRADRIAAVRELLDDGARLSSVAPEDTDVAADAPAASASPAGRQRVAAIEIIDAWLALTRDLLVSAAGRPDLAPSGEISTDLASVAHRLDPGALLEMVKVLERVRDGVLQNAAPRLALERAMLAWPSVDPASPEPG